MQLAKKYSSILKSLGPGLLWAGAAIGVSHLVQSTRAGASFGFSLVWIILIALVLKYPFFEFGPRYAAASGNSLLEGYKRLGNWALWLFLTVTILGMSAILAAVTIVTAGIASQLTGLALSPVIWSAIILSVCAIILVIGKYPALDMTIKVVIILLTISTVTAVIMTFFNSNISFSSVPVSGVWTIAGIGFIVGLVGWMPSAFDIAVWNSEWTIERSKQTGYLPKVKEALFDFNLGYIGTGVLALCFLTLGAMVMYGSGENFSPQGGKFASQLISIYTVSLGSWSYWIIIIAAFTTMFSTTLTVTDGFPRVLSRTVVLLFPNIGVSRSKLYWIWMVISLGGAFFMFAILQKSMIFFVSLATAISFVTAPVLAIMNYKVITGPEIPADAYPPLWLRILSWVGIVFLTLVSLAMLMWGFSNA